MYFQRLTSIKIPISSTYIPTATSIGVTNIETCTCKIIKYEYTSNTHMQIMMLLLFNYPYTQNVRTVG